MDLLWLYYLLGGQDPNAGYGYPQPDPYGGYYPQGPYYPQAPYYPPQPGYMPGSERYTPPYVPGYQPSLPPSYTGATLPSIQIPAQPQLPPVQPWPGNVPTQPGGRVAPPFIPPGSPGSSIPGPGTVAPGYRPAQPVGLPQGGYPVPPRFPTQTGPITGGTYYDSISGQIPRCSNVPPGYIGRCV